jgi:hypothetical protein
MIEKAVLQQRVANMWIAQGSYIREAENRIDKQVKNLFFDAIY